MPVPFGFTPEEWAEEERRRQLAQPSPLAPELQDNTGMYKAPPQTWGEWASAARTKAADPKTFLQPFVKPALGMAASLQTSPQEAAGVANRVLTQPIADSAHGVLEQTGKGLRGEEINPGKMTFDIFNTVPMGAGVAQAGLKAAGKQIGTEGAGDVAGMFVGRRALQRRAEAGDTKALDVLDLAATLDRQGIDRDTIWKMTGHALGPDTPFVAAHKGPDSQWRMEIDDSQARALRSPPPTSGSIRKGWTPEQTEMFPKLTNQKALKNLNRGNMLKHPMLYDLYPGMKKGKMWWTEGKSGDVALYRPWNDATSVNANFHPGQAQKDTLLHEFQHGVQQREGFASDGGDFVSRINERQMNFDYAAPDRKKQIEQAGKALDEVKGETEQVVREGLADRSDALFPKEPLSEGTIENYKKQFQNLKLYEREAGEAEARNVEHRSGMNLEQRRTLPPWKTQDVADDKQFISGFPRASMSGQFKKIDEPLSLVVARKLPDGGIRYGKPGQTHAELYTDDEIEAYMAPGASLPEKDLGFATPGGKFLTRNEAAKAAGMPPARSNYHELDSMELNQDGTLKSGYLGANKDAAPMSMAGNAIRAYHGTDRLFEGGDKFKPGHSYAPDRALGVHFAEDPEVSNSFLQPGYRTTDDTFQASGRWKDDSRVYPVDIHSKKMFNLEQPPYDYKSAASKPWETIATDQTEIAKLMGERAYKQDPKLLARYLVEARRHPPVQAAHEAKKLAAGETVEMEGRQYTLKSFINDFSGANPYNELDREKLVELGRKSLMDEGYDGIKYINTAPKEMQNATNPTSYVMFGPGTVKSATTGETLFANDKRAAAAPLSLYHGSQNNFSEFDTTRGEFGPHLGTPRQTDTITNSDVGFPLNNSKVYPVKADFKNPLEMNDHPEWDTLRPQFISDLMNRGFSHAETQPLWDWSKEYQTKGSAPGQPGRELKKKADDYVRTLLEKKGYDSIKYRNQHEGTSTFGPDDVPEIEENPWVGKGASPDKRFIAKQDGITLGYGSTVDEAIAAARNSNYAGVPKEDSYIPIKRGTVKNAITGETMYANNKKAAAAPMALNAAEDLWHPISPVKLSKPLSEMKHTIEPGDPMVPRKEMTPEDLYGSWLVPIVGDRSRVGQLKSIGDAPVDVRLQGGPDFKRTHAPEGTAWASGKGVVGGLQKIIDRAGADGKPVHGVYTAMGQPSVDFSLQMTDAIMDQMASAKVSKADKQAFDEFMRKTVKESGGDVELADWPGIDSKKAREWLQSVPGGKRKYLAKKMEKTQWRTKGFPDIAQTRHAIIEPSLLDVARGDAGYNVSQLTPGAKPIAEMKTKHPTYPFGLAGQYKGSMKPVSYDQMWQTGHKKRRAAGADPARDTKSIETGPASWVQFADDEWLENIMKHLQQ